MRCIELSLSGFQLTIVYKYVVIKTEKLNLYMKTSCLAPFNVGRYFFKVLIKLYLFGQNRGMYGVVDYQAK